MTLTDWRGRDNSAASVLWATACPVVVILFGYDLLHSEVVRPAVQEPLDAAVAGGVALTLVAAGVAALTALLVAVVSLYLRLSSLHGRLGTLLPEIAGTIAASPLLFVLARQPFIGNRYKDSPVAVYGPWVVFAGLLLLTFAGIWVATRLLRSTTSSTDSARAVRRFTLGGLTLAIVVLVAVDTLWYPGWYPLVHTVLSVCTAVLAHTGIAIAACVSTRAHLVAMRTSAAILPIVLLAAPLAWLAADQTTMWRVATGTLFASRVMSPIVQLRAATFAADALDGQPEATPTELTQHPAATGVPPALGSNAVLITVDALRFDAVGPHGATGSLTPKIDAFFANGHVFERAYAQYAATRKSVGGLLESRYHDPAPDRTDDLINRLRDYGFSVLAVLPSDLMTFVNVERYNFSRVVFYDDLRTVAAQVEQMIEGVPAENRFIWVHLYQPHDPYEPREKLGIAASARTLYDAEVRWVDDDFARLMSLLDSPASVVVLAADHGEEFREHGGTLHGRTLYDETIKVPLAIKVTGITATRRSELVANVDVAPTLLAALGIPVPDTYDGYDLLGRASMAPPDRVVYSESVTNGIAALRSDLKWIYWTDTNLWEAYDLRRDPRELRNLAGRRDVIEPGRALIASFQASAAGGPAKDAPRLQLAAADRRVETDALERSLDHHDVQVRLAAIAAVSAGDPERAVALLKRRRAAERSPSAVKAILESLLSLDRDEGVRAFRREIEDPLLSDQTRARMIADFDLVEASDHLVALFVESESVPFRNYLFNTARRLAAPPEDVRRLVLAMSPHAFEPELRSRIARYLQAERSETPDDENHEAGVARER